MGAVFAALLKYAVPLISALPQLIAGIESMFKGTPKAGAQKWIAVEQALSQSITLIAQEVAQLAPDGTTADEVSKKVVVFTRAVNNAFVQLMNDLGVFQHS